MIALVGSEGSMGKRYRAILNKLNVEFRPFDKETSLNDLVSTCKYSNGIILCTPTPTHFTFLNALIPLGKPILCEKPISKDPEEVIECFRLAGEENCSLTMMLQYQEILTPGEYSGDSSYNYFRTGNDGLVWDCMQTIALAKGKVSVKNDSPIWECQINGEKLDFRQMDSAYLIAVRKWLYGMSLQKPIEIIEMHQKTKAYAESYYGNN